MLFKSCHEDTVRVNQLLMGVFYIHVLIEVVKLLENLRMHIDRLICLDSNVSSSKDFLRNIINLDIKE
jgi:hypothetical protein